MIHADRTYEADMGVPREGYVYRAAEVAITNFMWKSTCPVHLTDYALHKEQKKRADVCEVRGESLEVVGPEPTVNYYRTRGQRVEDYDIETEFDNGRLRIRVRELLCGIEPDEKVADAAMMVIIGEGTTKEAAEIAGVPKKRITQTMDSIRDELMCRADLWRLWFTT